MTLLAPEEAVERIRMALTEVGRPDLAAAVRCTSCKNCGRRISGAAKWVPEEDVPLMNKAAEVAWHRPRLVLGRGRKPTPGWCGCDRLYVWPCGQLDIEWASNGSEVSS